MVNSVLYGFTFSCTEHKEDANCGACGYEYLGGEMYLKNDIDLEDDIDIDLWACLRDFKGQELSLDLLPILICGICFVEPFGVWCHS